MSWYMQVAPFCGNPNSSKKFRAHMIACAPVCAPMNSAAVLESAIMDCFLDMDINGVENRPYCIDTPVCDFEPAWQL